MLGFQYIMNTGLKRLFHLLRWSERYVRTDMVYLTGSGFWLNLNFAFVSVFALLLSIAFANLLSKNEFGIYQYVLAISSLLTALTYSGMNNAIARAVARGQEGTLAASIPKQLIWNLFPGTLACLIGAYYLFQGNMVLGIGMIAVGLTLPLSATFNSYLSFLNASRRFKIASLYTISGNAVYYLLIFVCIFLFPEALPLILVNLIVNALVACYLYWRTVRTYKPNSAVDPDALSYGRHLTFISVFSTAAAHVDKILVFQFFGAAPLASYALATLLPDRLVGAFKPLLVAAFPKFSRRSFNELQEGLPWKIAVIVLVTSIGAAAYSLFAPFLLSLFYPEYPEIIPFSQLYAFTFIATAGHLCSVALTAHKKLKELYTHTIASSLGQIVLMVVGVMLWGLWGLIIARVLSAALFGAIGLLLVQRERV